MPPHPRAAQAAALLALAVLCGGAANTAAAAGGAGDYSAWGQGDAGVGAKLWEGRPKDQNLGAKWGSNWIAVMGQMGIDLELVDAIYACSEG